MNIQAKTQAIAGVGLSLCLHAAVFAEPRETPDPWQAFNRDIHGFNQVIDREVAQPLARGYQAVVPDPIEKNINNIFNQLNDVTSLLNNLLQLKLDHSAATFSRLMINSSFGVLGLFDVATEASIPRYKEDFGQTLAYWGMDSGPYVVLPILGPNTVRDTFGYAVDWITHPLYLGVEDQGTRWALYTLEWTDRRAKLLSASAVLKDAALDDYLFVRDAYLQQRDFQIRDGQLPQE